MHHGLIPIEKRGTEIGRWYEWQSQNTLKDDRIMELVKLLVINSLLENNPDEEFDELRSAVEDGTNLLVLINMGKLKKGTAETLLAKKIMGKRISV